jgi:hypothetical protein
MKIQRGKAFVGDAVDGEVIVVNIDTGVFYSLTPSAAVLWESASQHVEMASDQAGDVLAYLIGEGILESESTVNSPVDGDSSRAFLKFEEMADILKADPIHEVGEDGWPVLS